MMRTTRNLNTFPLGIHPATLLVPTYVQPAPHSWQDHGKSIIRNTLPPSTANTAACLKYV